MSHELLFNYPRHFSRNTINIKSVAKIICSYFFVKQWLKLTVMEQAYIYRYEYDLIKSQGREKENGKWSVNEIAENEN